VPKSRSEHGPGDTSARVWRVPRGYCDSRPSTHFLGSANYLLLHSASLQRNFEAQLATCTPSKPSSHFARPEIPYPIPHKMGGLKFGGRQTCGICAVGQLTCSVHAYILWRRTGRDLGHSWSLK
jgi:hypothetical protein